MRLHIRILSFLLVLLLIQCQNDNDIKELSQQSAENNTEPSLVSDKEKLENKTTHWGQELSFRFDNYTKSTFKLKKDPFSWGDPSRTSWTLKPYQKGWITGEGKIFSGIEVDITYEDEYGTSFHLTGELNESGSHSYYLDSVDNKGPRRIKVIPDVDTSRDDYFYVRFDIIYE